MDKLASHDGVNTFMYKKGGTYEARHGQEKILFENFIREGVASYYVEAQPEIKTKVTRPKSRK